MMRLAVNELTTYRWTLEEDLETYRRAGITGIGVWRQKLTDYGEHQGIELVFDSGLEVSSLQWAGGFTGNDGCSHRDSIQDGFEAIELAAAIQANCLATYTGGRGGHTKSHARRLALSAIRELAQYAADLDVTLAIEPMHSGCGRDWTFLHDLERTIEFIDEVDSNNVKILFDTYHFVDQPDILSQISSLADRIGLVQLGDALRQPFGEQDRCPLGQGVLPLQDIVQCLQESGYSGFYEIELLGQEIEILDYHALLDQSCNAIFDFARVAS